ncbi:UvrD-helicase domain-containing protein [Aerococcus kribbianus]|uniref:ATP-dependent DNA helicase PcrA n=1 Tax=Aerococcus kribbianus TaxID=2999064 RepID=A0A9X3JGN9_9LACT|nr:MULTISPECIES: UvrD-helicase domain-containing protein [unclassified Aerococcus]MCZ0717471.1 UvrD-helicase domain-containing protein [Aerococcus sp. YH-aer221]MCZ0725759.1 UvrD-helicase domain-containing protein [Aerococcus sp. YH-aer222]
MTADQLITGLNDKQKEAVLHTEGPLLIMAGAGSGKTRVLTHRMAYILAEKEVNPWNILAITFTNKAAREMQDRVQALVGPEAQQMWVSTFHSMCVRILRREAEAIGYSRSFTIADPSEQQTLMKRIIKDLNLDSKKFRHTMILGKISDAKNNLQTPSQYRESHSGYIEDVVADCYDRYQAALDQAQSMDFDDLIMQTVRLFTQDKDILRYYQEKFHYIHVDEYQDTNEAQYKIVQLLGGLFQNVCVVGDADQSIYGWRGANMENILNFESDYPQATTILLEQNYRSTKTILQAANAVIANNEQRKEKALWTEKEAGDKIQYYTGQSEQDESYFVIQKIKDLVADDQYNYGDFAILYRTNAQSRVIEENLVKANLPYRMVGGHKFYDRKEIKDVLAYLRLLANPDDNLSFTRVINVPKRGIGPGSLEKLRQFANDKGLNLLMAASAVDFSPLTGKAAKSLKNFAKMMENLQKQREFLSITELTQEILDQSGYLTDLKSQNSLEAEARIENIEEFLSVTADFDKNWQEEESAVAPNEDDSPTTTSNQEATSSIGEFAADGSMQLFAEQELQAAVNAQFIDVASDDALMNFITDLSLVADREEDDQASELTLMTLHAAKGLEFPVVFLIGMEEGIFPLQRAAKDEEELEEERRLAYVGITRAEEKLFLTNAYSRMLYGRQQANPASRFISEIDSELIDSQGRHYSHAFSAYGQDKSASGQSLNTYFSQQRQERAQSRPYRGSKSGSKHASHAGGSIFSPKGSQKADPSMGNADQEWAVGDQAYHKKWGTGRVVRLTGSQDDLELYIAFEDQGVKRLLAAFAPIEKVND